MTVHFVHDEIILTHFTVISSSVLVCNFNRLNRKVLNASYFHQCNLLKNDYCFCTDYIYPFQYRIGFS